jgi:lysophospholipase L1-like esterase
MRRRAALLTLPLLVASLSGQQPAPAAAPPQPAAAPGASCPEMASALTRLMGADARQRDWPQLGRYREDNRTRAKPAAGESRVVFMGDSITDAWPNGRFGDYFATHTAYVGRGISGQTTPQMLIRFRSDVIDLDPKVVVILAGTNDIAGNTGTMTNEEIQNNLMSMAELAKAHKIKVVLSSILPTSNYHVVPTLGPQTALRPMERIRVLNDWMKKYAAAEGHVYLDYVAAMSDPSGLLRAELSADDLHPNAQGYAIMAPLAEAAIKQALR